MTDELDLDALEALHEPEAEKHCRACEIRCERCREQWPCVAVRLIARVREAEEKHLNAQGNLRAARLKLESDGRALRRERALHKDALAQVRALREACLLRLSNGLIGCRLCNSFNRSCRYWREGEPESHLEGCALAASPAEAQP